MVVKAKELANGRATEIGGEAPTNSAEEVFVASMPYTVEVELVGVADLLFHRWNVEGNDAKAKAAKGSKAKKSDDVASYVYRNDDGELCIPGEYVRQAIIHAAKFRQDPRSPRKSAFDLYKAGIIGMTHLAPVCRDHTALKTWDYEDRRRVTIQRNGITRTRPAVKSGWRATFQFLINLPEYISPADLHDVLTNAGRLIGLADFRPTYGRFQVAKFEILTDE